MTFQYRIEFVADPPAVDMRIITEGLLAPYASEPPKAAYEPLTFFARNRAGEIVGGVIGNTGPRWLYISALWVGEAERRMGLGSQLMDQAESEAMSRGCLGAYLDTLDARAVSFYRRRDYHPFGQLEGFAGDRTRYFLRKQLLPAETSGRRIERDGEMDGSV